MRKSRDMRTRDDSGGELRDDLIDKDSPRRPSAVENEEEEPSRRRTKYINLLFCIKYKNSGKLSSHNWFFNGICN